MHSSSNEIFEGTYKQKSATFCVVAASIFFQFSEEEQFYLQEKV